MTDNTSEPPVAERVGDFPLIVAITSTGTVDVIVQRMSDGEAARWLRKAAARLEARAATQAAT